MLATFVGVDQLDPLGSGLIGVGQGDTAVLHTDYSGDIVNSGEFTFDGSPSITIGGDYRQTNSGVTRIEIGLPAGFGGFTWVDDILDPNGAANGNGAANSPAFLKIAGKAFLSGTLDITGLKPSLKPGDRIPLMRFDGLEGRFTSMTGMETGFGNVFLSLQYRMPDSGDASGATGIDLVVLEKPRLIYADGTIGYLDPGYQGAGLTIVTHGWNSSVVTPGNDFAKIAKAMAGKGSGWDIAVFDWSTEAELTLLKGWLPWWTAERAYDAGDSLRMWLQSSGFNYQNFHLLAHSAGTWVVSAIADGLPASTSIDVTLFDGFTPDNTRIAGVGPATVSGNFDRGQNIYCEDLLADTQDYRSTLINVDISSLRTFGDVATQVGSHARPYKWYLESIDRTLPALPVQVEALGFGLAPTAGNTAAREQLENESGYIYTLDSEGFSLQYGPKHPGQPLRMPVPASFQGAGADLSVLRSMASEVAAGLRTDEPDSQRIAGGNPPAAQGQAFALAGDGGANTLGDIPVFGAAAAAAGASVVSSLLGYAGDSLSLDDLYDLGFRIESALSPDNLYRWIYGKVLDADSLASVTFSKANTRSATIAGDGSIGFTVGGQKMAAQIAGSATGEISGSAQITAGLSPSFDVFVVEGGAIELAAGAAISVSGSASVGSLVNASLSGKATLAARMGVKIDDGDETKGERLFLKDISFADLVDTTLQTTLEGSVKLDEARLALDILPAVSGLPDLAVSATASYDLVEGTGSFDVSQDALIDTAGRLVAAGFKKMRDASSQLATLALEIPLIGKDVASVVDRAIADRLAFTFPEDGVRAYLKDRGFELKSVMSFEDIVSGTASLTDLVRVRYNNPAAAAANGSFDFSGRLGSDALSLALSGKANVTPTLGVDVTFGVDLAKGPYILEGSNLAVTLPVSGTFQGTASIGTLFSVGASVVANLSPHAVMTIDDGNDTPEERLYLFGSDGVLVPILSGEETTASFDVEVTGKADFVASLTVDNALDKIPLLKEIGVSLPSFTWTADGSIDLATNDGSYAVRQDKQFETIVGLFAGLEDKALDLLVSKVQANNPLPEDLRTLLTAKLPVLDKSLLEILNISPSGQLLINPTAFRGKKSSEIESSQDTNKIDVKFDLIQPASVLALLSGKPADLISIDVDQRFELVEQKFPVAVVPLFSIVVASVTLDVNALANFFFDIDVSFGFDTNGFYVRRSASPTNFAFSLGGTVGVDQAVTGRIGIIPVAEVGVAAAIKLAGGLSFDPASGLAKLRVVDLFDLENLRVGLTADADLRLRASLGYPPLGVATSTNKTIPLLAVSKSLEGLNEQIDKVKQEVSAFKRKIDEKRDELLLLINPGAYIVYKTIEPLGKAIEDTRKEGERFGGVIAAEGKQAARDAKMAAPKARDNINKTAARFDENVTQPLLRGIGLGNVKTTPAPPREKFVVPESWYSFDASVQSRVLRIASHNRAQELVFGIEGGELIVDGKNEQREEITSYLRDGNFQYTIPKKSLYEHANMQTFGLADFDRIEVIGSNHADVFLVSPSITKPVRIEGRDGDDSIEGGAGNDELYGGHGTDTIFGGSGNDHIFGEWGADRLYGQLGDDIVDGGDGADVLDESVGGVAGRTGERNVLDGGSGNDTLVGCVGPDTLRGGSEDDTISGEGGDDVIEGGSGNDRLFGGDGNDRISGGSGNDYAAGGAGDDTIAGEDGDDVLPGESGADRLTGGAGRDSLQGGIGDDFLDGEAGADFVDGGAGDDECVGGPDDLTDGNDVVWGGEGRDTLRGGWGAPTAATYTSGNESFGNLLGGGDDDDIIDGGSGVDTITGGDGNDVLRGNGGNDAIFAEAGVDFVYGGAGNDKLYGSVGAGPLTSTLYGDDDDDELYGVGYADALFGGRGNDTFWAGPGDDFLDGGEGNDILNGEEGDDRFTGGLGDDRFVGGVGTDRLDETGDVDFTLTDVSLTGLGSDTLDSIEIAVLDGGVSANTFIVRSWTGDARLDAKAGDDSYAITFTLAGSERVAVTDSAGAADRLGVTGTTAADAIDVTVGGVRRGTQAVLFTGIEAVAVSGDGGADTITVRGTAVGVPVSVSGNADDDLVNVATGNLDDIAAPVTVAGDSGNDRIVANDSGVAFAADYLVTPTTVSSMTPSTARTRSVRTFAGITYDGTTELVRLDGSDGVNIFDVQPSRDTAYTIDGNAPASGFVEASKGDYLKLDTKTTFPADPRGFGLDTSGRRLTIQERGTGRWDFTKGTGHKPVAFESIERFNHVDILAIAAEAGSGSSAAVQVFDAETLVPLFTIDAAATYGARYRDGVRVATGDLDNDGIPDVAVAPGRMAAPVVKVFNGVPQAGVQGTEIAGLRIPASATYGAKYVDGVTIAVGDVLGDTLNEIVITPSRGRAIVKVFENTLVAGSPYARFGKTPARTFDAFTALKGYIGGGSLAIGDTAGLGKQQIVVGSGVGTNGRVHVFDVRRAAAAYAPLRTIVDPTLPAIRGGLHVAVGDIDGDGRADIVTGAGAGSGAWVRGYSGATGSQLFAVQTGTNRNATIPTRVTVRTLDGVQRASVFATWGADARQNYRIMRLDGPTRQTVDEFKISAIKLGGGGMNIG
jgi:Ca2+-binding RTX toxin-like protein